MKKEIIEMSFESIFKSVLNTLKANNTLTEQLWSEIKSNYSQSWRHYHNVEHLNFMIVELIAVRNEIEDWPILVFSVAYHDFIYDSKRDDNEERSAISAADRLTKLGMHQKTIDKCRYQILATKQHQKSEEQDTNYLIDADLAILGTERQLYLRYTGQIRKEYGHVPANFYSVGRGKVLEHFLNMEYIYKTKYFWEKFESQARNNIAGELKSLLNK